MASGLLHSLLSSRLIVTRSCYRSRAGFCGCQRLIVHLLGHFLFVQQRLVAVNVILRLHIIGFGSFQLSMRGGDAIFGVNDSGARVFHARCGELQLAGSIHGSNRNIDIQRLGRCFRARENRFCLFNRDLVVFRVDLYEHRPFLYVLVVVHIHFDHVPGNAAADRVEMRVHLGIIGGFVASQISPQEKAAHEHN